MLVLLKNEGKRNLLSLWLSFIALVVSFFDIAELPADAAWVAIALCGLPIIKGAVTGLVTEFDVKADVLVSIALVASVFIGEIFAAGEVAFIMKIGSFLEERTVAKARAGIEKLARLMPAVARVLRDGAETSVPASEVAIGDTLRVLAGETIPADGVIVKGQTSVDQSVMTGESLPVDKTEGDAVLSGTVNQFGTFDMKSERAGNDSSLQRMIRLVESADASKAKIVSMADRWATWIVAIALTAAIATWFVTGEIIRSVTVLVVFCPCALVLATPTAIMAGIGNLTRSGVLVSRGDALERMAKVRRMAFDKTGTLTYGRPSVTEVFCRDSQMSDIELLKIAAISESLSEHPLGKAIVAHYRQQTGQFPPDPESFRLLAGRGVSAKIDGQDVLAGNEQWLEESGVPLPEAILKEAMAANARGCTVIYVALGGRALGFIALSDALRPNAAAVMDEIRACGVRLTLLTGDAGLAARYIAQAAGISDVKAHCLPEDKLAEIRQCQGRGEPVCMVGDGINDAPALKAANVGIAMGGVGSDIAIEAADIALVGDDIGEIPHLLSLSKKVMRTINLNLAASMALNFVAVALAVTGVLNPVTGALVHNAGSVAVVVNSSLLLGWREKPSGRASPAEDCV
ncbi:MAG: cation-translocating P-type ATPase [Synergistaceae bacterium]|jgi:heavy metal translocating P-type ATPase|nr:cation-translocating P-type ATPase [Synergistaceae bacterium]